MWEDATPKPVPEEPQNNARPEARSSGENLVLWAQILLVGLALAGIFAARQLDLPVYDKVRNVLTQALQQPGLDGFDGERNLLRFVQTGMNRLQQTAVEVTETLSAPVTAESARPAHGQPEPDAPAGASSESYLPDFALALPLPDGFTTTSGYGWRDNPLTEDGSRDFHLGRDLAAAEGSPVYAAADGMVRRAGTGDSYGNYLRILHAGGDETLYAHMQYLFVHAGQQVRQGQIIGTVGQTGDVTGPHLHFELLHGGIRYDPSQALGLA